MRPRPVVGEATVPDAVRRLLDKFDYPVRESPSQVIPILPTLGGGSGGAPTIVVAASNASPKSIARADFVCTGTDDQDTIQVAINSLGPNTSPHQGYRVLLTEGLFYINMANQAYEGIRFQYGVLEGMGREATVLTVSADPSVDHNPVLMLQSSRATVRDLNIVGGVSKLTTAIESNAYDSQIENCLLGTNGYAVVLYDDVQTVRQVTVEGDYGFLIAGQKEVTVVGCDIQPSVGAGIEVAGGNDSLLITGNYIFAKQEGVVITGAGHTKGRITGNAIESASGIGEHGISLTDATDFLITGNTLYQIGAETNNTYDAIFLAGNSDRNVIAQNLIRSNSVSPQTRYGINVSAATCNDNRIYANDMGAAADYGTAEFNDAGTGTLWGPEAEHWNLGELSGRVANQVVQWDGTDFILGAVSAGLVDHGGLLGLGDVADHLLYLDLAGTRAMTGALDMGEFGISNVGEVSLDSISPDVDDINFLKGDNASTWLLWDESDDRAEISTDVFVGGKFGVGVAAIKKFDITDTSGAIGAFRGSVASADSRIEFYQGGARQGYLLWDNNSNYLLLFADSGLYMALAAGGAERIRIEADGDVGIGITAPAAQLHIDQSSTSAAQPVLTLDQADVSEEMIEFVTTIGVGNAIEAVGAKALTTTHFIKATLPGGLTRYIPAGTIA